ncbi:MAG: 4-hydroxythreonine-4-phosphate dehydrogenase PdxA, partial [Pseudomonadota bacterium]
AQPNPQNAHIVIDAIEMAAQAVRNGQASALVTAPIHKASLQTAGFAHPGHTEFLGAIAQATPIMMLAGADLRCIPLSVHQSLASVTNSVTHEKIIETASIAHRFLQRFCNIETPRIAIAGLNPHAGEGGQFGDEEIRIITPAIMELRKAGIVCEGPLAADSMFHPAARASYDVALCMYHDQALIPIKTLDFHGSINITIGLDFIRTSPDHGTAFDIAGRGIANPASMIAALQMAQNLAQHNG